MDFVVKGVHQIINTFENKRHFGTNFTKISQEIWKLLNFEESEYTIMEAAIWASDII